MAGIAPGPVKTTAPVPPAAVSASADDAEKLARWRETKEKEWRNTTGNLRKKYATKEQLALYLDRQCAKALEKKKGSARGGGPGPLHSGSRLVVGDHDASRHVRRSD
jgi:hypothetical protein